MYVRPAVVKFSFHNKNEKYKNIIALQIYNIRKQKSSK